ncbi:hypothetical protein [Kribbella amoyensis]|uniref:hypothetical protein n=1 Tax=Kribbella amoyensis TaxID=996641 RepID=UPI0011A41C03|nr:hypothetical protein [Kribbella amoyensis]
MRKFGAAALLLALCSSVGVIATSGTPATAAGDATSASRARTDELTLRTGQTLAKVKASIPSGSYAGAYVDPSSGTLRVLVTQQAKAPALDTRADAPLELVKARYSLAYLEQRMGEVFAAREKLNGKNSRIVSVDVDEAANSLQVAVDGPIDAALRGRITRLAPDTPLELVQGNSFAPQRYAGSRVDDFAPWSAGVFIYNKTTGGGCSSGPGVHVGSTKYMVTAAHCATATGQQFYQGHQDVPSVTPELVGTVANRSGYPNLDAMLVNGNTANTVYRSWYNFYTASSAPWESLTGQTVCTGGAYSGERCGLVIGQTNVCSDSLRSCGLTIATGPVNTVAAGEGDSGGPVYITAPGLRYSGIVTGPVNPANSITCLNYPSGLRSCSNAIVFTRIQNILAYFGASLN